VKLVLIGVGMIGGSLAGAWRRSGVVDEVVGFDVDRRALDAALARGLIDAGAATVEDALPGAGLVLVATPVGAMPQAFAALSKALPPRAIVTDVGSTKGGVIAEARVALGDAFARFVPAHPIAGKELPGVEHADAALFAGRRVIVTPAAETDPEATRQVEGFFAATGARVERMDAAEHDLVFAAVSHLPHLLSFALVAAIGQGTGGERNLAYGGAGFRDFTRIAAASPVMWRDICVANRQALGQELRRYRAMLDQLQQAVDAADGQALQQVFELASTLRRQWTGTVDAG
jgi:prephenate dehydrogenase